MTDTRSSNVNTLQSIPDNESELDSELGGPTRHSLPAPDEIKADRQSKSSSVIDNRPLYAILVLLIVTAIAVGLSVGLTGNKRSASANNNSLGSNTNYVDGNTIIPPGSKDRYERIKNYLIQNGISTEKDFDFVYSPQSLALNWIVNDDKILYSKNVPKGDITTPEGYDFITRYILSVFYYSTSGPTSWNFQLFFNSPKQHICDWFFVFNQPYGQLGVLCDKDSENKIVGLSFSKLSV